MCAFISYSLFVNLVVVLMLLVTAAADRLAAFTMKSTNEKCCCQILRISLIAPHTTQKKCRMNAKKNKKSADFLCRAFLSNEVLNRKSRAQRIKSDVEQKGRFFLVICTSEGKSEVILTGFELHLKKC